jgi:hypothetical protein
VAKAQDLIVTNNIDSIHCKILSIGDSIKYNYFLGGVKKVNTLPSNLVLAVVPNFFKESIKHFEDSTLYAQKHRSYKQLRSDGNFYSDKKFRISMNVFYANRLAFLNDYKIYNVEFFTNDIIDKIKHQYGGNIEVSISLNQDRTKYIGFQVGRSQNNTNIANSTLITKNMVIYNGVASIETTFTSYSINYLDAFKMRKPYNLLYFTIGLTVNELYEDVRIGNYNAVVSGRNLGGMVGFLYDNRIGKNLALGIGTYLDLGYITKITIKENGYEKKSFETDGKIFGTGRLLFSLGLRYYIGKS